MKDFLKKYFGILGIAVWYICAVIIRIPVAIFLALYIVVLLLIWNPVMRRDDNCSWITRLYDWYNAQ